MVHTCIVCKRVEHLCPEDITFHRFPKNPEKRNLWLELVGKSEVKALPKYPELCSDHFFPEDLHIRSNGSRYIRVGANPRRCEGVIFLDEVSTRSESSICGCHKHTKGGRRHKINSTGVEISQIAAWNLMGKKVHMSPINSPDDVSRDPAPSTSHCYMESKNFASPLSDSSFCDYDATEIKTEIKIEEEEIVLPKYPDNSNQSLEHDEESPLVAKLKDELRRLSDLCAKQKQMLEQSSEIRPQIKIENQHLTQEEDFNNTHSEVNAKESSDTKSSHLMKRQICKKRRFIFQKIIAPAGSLQFALNFSSKNSYEYIKRARDFRLNLNGFSAGFKRISKTHRKQYHTSETR